MTSLDIRFINMYISMNAKIKIKVSKTDDIYKNYMRLIGFPLISRAY
jgi:uncharacterized protein YozE (UPF0346 family)